MDYIAELLARKKEIEEAMDKQRDYLRTPMSESLDELSMYDQHPADTATDTYEREKSTGILELLAIELEKTEDAIDKYRQGKYGICEICRQPIEPQRLQRLVNTTLCARCAANTTSDDGRPEEEDVISAGDMSDRGETFQVAGYELYEE